MRFFVAHVACLVLCSGASEASTQAESEACVPGAWGEWSACTKTCGGGSQTNKRKGQCTKKGVPWLAQRNCNTGVCKMDCESIWVSDGANPRTEGRESRCSSGEFISQSCQLSLFSCSSIR
jgi:hypothetical protein